jgi:hypothetical protein
VRHWHCASHDHDPRVYHDREEQHRCRYYLVFLLRRSLMLTLRYLPSVLLMLSVLLDRPR